MDDVYNPSLPNRPVNIFGFKDRYSTKPSIVTMWSLFHMINCWAITLFLLKLGITPGMAILIVFFLGVVYEYKDFNMYYLKKKTLNSTLDNSLGDIVFNTFGSLIAVYYGYSDEKLFLAICSLIGYNIWLQLHEGYD